VGCLLVFTLMAHHFTYLTVIHERYVLSSWFLHLRSGSILATVVQFVVFIVIVCWKKKHLDSLQFDLHSFFFTTRHTYTPCIIHILDERQGYKIKPCKVVKGILIHMEHKSDKMVLQLVTSSSKNKSM